MWFIVGLYRSASICGPGSLLVGWVIDVWVWKWRIGACDRKIRCTYLWFTGRWSGVEVWVMCPVCGMFLYCLCFVVCPLQAIPHPIPPPSRQTNYQTMPQRAEPSFSTGLRSSPLHTTKQSQSRNIPQTWHITHSPTPDQRPVNQRYVHLTFYRMLLFVTFTLTRLSPTPLAGYLAHRY